MNCPICKTPMDLLEEKYLTCKYALTSHAISLSPTVRPIVERCIKLAEAAAR